MPCWSCSGRLSVAEHLEATGWFLCDDCRDDSLQARTLQEARAESPTEAGSERAVGQDARTQSPPPGARPGPDPATLADARRATTVTIHRDWDYEIGGWTLEVSRGRVDPERSPSS